ncbi:RING-H2 finger protein ATL79-like [Typha latifolia]|uniref:RING-H2 finger protein ATL79-like n=1 Tax=Typha latifolia TaxID=4733 RepID=UPI003C2AC0D5
MKPPPINTTTNTTSPPLPYHPIPSPKWTPYSNAKDFDANMVTVLIILVCATLLAFSLHAVARLLRRRQHPPPLSPPLPDMAKREEQPASYATAEAAANSLLFSAGVKMAAEEAECPICLSEFVVGDRVRVLPTCNHGFHAACVEAWLVSRFSCPTCRAPCRSPGLPPEGP